MKEQYKQVFKVAVRLWSRIFGVGVGVPIRSNYFHNKTLTLFHFILSGVQCFPEAQHVLSQ